jgi:catechol-2,3-dioxygenase
MRWMNSSAAAFVAVGGYHHLGFNVWRGESELSVPEGGFGRRHWTVTLEDPEERRRGERADPWGRRRDRGARGRPTLVRASIG